MTPLYGFLIGVALGFLLGITFMEVIDELMEINK